MKVFDALLGRRTVYRYDDKAVPAAAIDRALEAARWAPNHKLTEPWRFTVVGKETLGRLGPIAGRLAEKKAEGVDDAQDKAAIIERQINKVTNLPALVAVSMVKNPDDAFREREDYAAVSCAVHNMTLSLFADGLGSQWGTGGITRDPETYQVLSIDPAVEEIVGFIKIGYAARIPETRRRPLEDVRRDLP